MEEDRHLEGPTKMISNIDTSGQKPLIFNFLEKKTLIVG